MDKVSALVELNNRLTIGERAGDAAALRELLDEKLRFRRADGSVVDVGEFLASLGTDGYRNDLLEADLESLDVRGDQAVALVLVRFRGLRGGQPSEGVFRNIRLFEWTSGGWQLVLWFNKRVGDLPPDLRAS